MNLHAIRQTAVWIWVATRGGNGRSMGTHLYEAIWKTTIPTLGNRPAWIDDRGWQTRIRAWLMTPPIEGVWTNRNWLRNPWFRPLCGKQSRAQHVSYDPEPIHREWRECPDCRIEAARRGITPRHADAELAPESPLFGEMAQIARREGLSV
jgi:hypothetical protein